MIAEAANPAAELAERLWRAYAPYRRGRGTVGDLDAMLAILVLAAFAEAGGRPEGDFVKRWKRASAEAAAGFSPVAELRGLCRTRPGIRVFRCHGRPTSTSGVDRTMPPG